MYPALAKARSVKAAVDAERARRAALAARKSDAENDLLEFVDMFWRVVEPVTPLVKGWVLSAMADALMAVTDGHLTRVILNVPPGSMKSMLLNVFWPAWEWGPMNMPHLRYLSASYSSAIPERDNGRLLRVITDPVYLRCWGDRFGVIRAGMTLVENDKTGWKRVISTSSGTTGHRGDRILCLPADAVITTDAGDMRIGDIVHERRNVRIAGWSGSAVEWQAIERYETNPPGAMVRIRYARGALTCTADHRVWVKGRGYVAAESIVPDDVLRCIVGGALVPTVSAVSGVDRLGFDGRPTYNLRVGPHHNYFANGVLVHNCDDLNDPNDVESPSVRAATVHWVREVMPDRLNNMQQSAIINVQQRTHEQDATGILAEHGDNYTWISIPMEFDPLRLCRAALRWDEDGEVLQEWVDPRGVDADGKELAGLYEDERGNLKVTMGSPMAQAAGTLAWPERFPPDTVAALKKIKGPYAWEGQYNQHPTVRGGAIIQRDWWQTWAARHYPSVGTVMVSVDTAIKENEAADYTACTVWGAFADDGGAPQVMMLDAWRDRLSLAETVARVGDSCFRWKADYLLIEDKARGHDASVEIQRHYTNRTWETVLIKVNSNSGDKEARLRAVSHLFSGDVRRDPVSGIDVWVGGMVWAPATEWAEEVINEVTSFPRGVHDDYVDTVSQVMHFMRRHGVVLRKAEHEANEYEARKFRKTPGVPYAVGRQ